MQATNSQRSVGSVERTLSCLSNYSATNQYNHAGALSRISRANLASFFFVLYTFQQFPYALLAERCVVCTTEHTVN